MTGHHAVATHETLPLILLVVLVPPMLAYWAYYYAGYRRNGRYQR